MSGEGILPLNVSPKTVEAVYRQLRTSLEASKAFSAAADFYYGEMEMRRLAAPRMSAEHVLLALYKVTCGYGVRASRALATYATVLLLTGAALRYRTAWFVADPSKVAASRGLHFTNYWDCLAIAAQNSVTFFGGASDGWTAAGVALMFAVRLIGPAAFAFMRLALRSRGTALSEATLGSHCTSAWATLGGTKRVIPAQLERCEVTNKRALKSELQNCHVTGKRVLRSELEELRRDQ